MKGSYLKFISTTNFAPQEVRSTLSPFTDYLIEMEGIDYFLKSLSTSTFFFYVVFSSLTHLRLRALRSTDEDVLEAS